MADCYVTRWQIQNDRPEVTSQKQLTGSIVKRWRPKFPAKIQNGGSKNRLPHTTQSVLQIPSTEASPMYYSRKINLFNLTIYEAASPIQGLLSWNGKDSSAKKSSLTVPSPRKTAAYIQQRKKKWKRVGEWVKWRVGEWKERE
ncbi:hypothetical protein LSTR_LSTR000491 [Laodelphax striatellus]|uniref:Uncharacterized protein n=1 Tax=Laodelphax striatellus TaxID=195883 RepID=A0A482X277_LAOST|nr:hypothetical protein LSTR_LSTR000491 [Laodelphax striatellus]